MSIRSQWVGGMQRFYDPALNDETVHVMAPTKFEDDFHGFQAMLTESGSTGPWSVVEVALNTAIAKTADVSGGAVRIVMDADSNAEDGVLYFGNERSLNVASPAIFECRVRATVLPSAAECRMVWGLAGDHNLAKDSVAEHAWFRLEGAAGSALLVETDDTTNDNDDEATGITVTTSGWLICRIDLLDLTAVRFYVNGDHVGGTYDMSNLAGAELVLQPYFSVEKDSGTGLGTLDIDYVRFWGKR